VGLGQRLGRLRRFLRPGRSVREDWAARLPGEMRGVFEGAVGCWESANAMAGVALNDAIALRVSGNLVCAQQQASVSSDLVVRLAVQLEAACEIIQSEARHRSAIPSVEPLHAEHFRSESAKDAATWNSLLHQVLFGARSRFFHKLRVLGSTVESLARQFEEHSLEIAEGTSPQPGVSWEELETLQYDLNTCLKECEIVLKSFLLSLPSEMAADMRRRFEAPIAPTPGRSRTRLSHVSA